MIVPTRNEAGTFARIIAVCVAAQPDTRFETIFVDDWSTGGAADRIAEIARDRSDVRVLRRFGRPGLSSTVIEGMMATMAPVVAAIDGDGQHDEPRPHSAIAGGQADVATGSCCCVEGSTGAWDTKRLRAARTATRLLHLVCAPPAADPMSGFFAAGGDLVEVLLPRLPGRSFEILFDLLTTRPSRLPSSSCSTASDCASIATASAARTSRVTIR